MLVLWCWEVFFDSFWGVGCGLGFINVDLRGVV